MTTTVESTATAVDLAASRSSPRVAGDRAIAYNAILVYLGDRLGLWQQLASVGSVDQPSAGGAFRAVRAAPAGVARDPGGRRLRLVRRRLGSFSLSTEHAMVLADEDSPAAGIAGFEVIAAIGPSVDRLANAYATGDGLGWHEHDSRLFTGVERFYWTLYRSSLITEWLPAVDGLVSRLESGIRVADIGCGLGSATILMAQAFPASTFVGIDYHEESVRRATAAAESAGVSDRVQFLVGDASEYAGEFDLVCYFDAVHDMGDPVGALGHARRALAPGGQVFAVEPYAEDTLEANLANPVALTFYAASSALCVPHSVSDGGAALGAQAGPARLVAAFADAGFGNARVAAATPYNLVIEARA